MLVEAAAIVLAKVCGIREERTAETGEGTCVKETLVRHGNSKLALTEQPLPVVGTDVHKFTNSVS